MDWPRPKDFISARPYRGLRVQGASQAGLIQRPYVLARSVTGGCYSGSPLFRLSHVSVGRDQFRERVEAWWKTKNVREWFRGRHRIDTERVFDQALAELNE